MGLGGWCCQEKLDVLGAHQFLNALVHLLQAPDQADDSGATRSGTLVSHPVPGRATPQSWPLLQACRQLCRP